jgi:NADPH:quinone reductase-like Zn-dependent oxidoreductase
MTVKRIQYHQYGGPEVMRLEDFEPAPPGAGEVRATSPTRACGSCSVTKASPFKP